MDEPHAELGAHAMPPELKNLTEEQLDGLLEAFNELQVTGYLAGIVGRSGNIAVEIRNAVIDPDDLAFILDVAKRHSLRPYVFQTEHGAPMILHPLRETVKPASPETTPTVSAVIADEEATIVHPPSEDAPEEQFAVQLFGDSVAISLPSPDPDTDGPTVSLRYEGILEQPIALEIAEAIGNRAAAATAAGTDPAVALEEAFKHGQAAFLAAKSRLAPDVEAPADAVRLDEIDD